MKKDLLPLLVSFLLALVLWFIYLWRQGAPEPSLADLGHAPDWSSLDPCQESITRADFERLLSEVFIWDKNTEWKNLIRVEDTRALIRKELHREGDYELRFAPSGQAQEKVAESSRLSGSSPAPGHQTTSPRNPSLSTQNTTRKIPRYWRPAASLPPLSDPAKPLAGLKVAIDPGHIGGDYARMEERYFRIGDAPPVMEGEMTLLVAKLLKPRLEALGATVALVRAENAPVTPLRPPQLEDTAARSLPEDDPAVPVVADSQDRADASPALAKARARKLFYRAAEIRARARLVNQKIRPDLVLCLHFNAEDWGNPLNPELTDRHHFHLILHGAYMDGELAHDDERHQLLLKLLQRVHAEERSLALTVADAFLEKTGLPPYTYAPEKPAMNIAGHPALWARNLLANRLYTCPVLFLEPYVMNSSQDYPRIQAGDYEGLREVNGKSQPSIFREYADTLAEALRLHYLNARPQKTD